MDTNSKEFAKFLDAIIEEKVKTIYKRETGKSGLVKSWTATVTAVNGSLITVKLPGDDTHTIIKKNRTGAILEINDEVYLFSPSGDLTNAFVAVAKNKVPANTGVAANYDALSNRPIINSTNTSSLATSATETLTGTFQMHKVAKTGSYTDLLNQPMKFGDVAGGNYSEFESDGTLAFVGNATVYDDILNQLIGQRLESPSSDIIQNGAEGSLTFKTTATINDYVTMGVQISHSWKLGTAVYPHLHWWQEQANVPNWLLQYRWQKNGQAKTTAWTNMKLNTNVYTYTSGSLNQISYGTGITPPSGYSLSDIVQCRIVRDKNNGSTLFTGADPYTVGVDAVSFDIHYIKDTVGSRTEYSK